MEIKWNKTALKNLISALEYFEENDSENYSKIFEKELLEKVRNPPQTYQQYNLDKFRFHNDGNYRVLFIDSYRVSFRIKENEIRILRIRHGSRKPIYYKR